ncbi:MAG: hypothetical protein KatS3mg074_007 [Meiothermus sp.]|uniref:Uncharacterized protein n=2 Tax=Meiothermus hypogaeus TaxID=884155 RepID=A0A511QWT1_9DEIN|nr:hypothetical protein [Meiothermus hypogaeus]RIH79194.1 hypothetical protein Mhypo_01192 [Meiothermus hypogaeus]GEM81840.1 hypothetical protein MHY01S_00060 [Meiothermus hypogaeus NBRC 106114]GIW37609.1 MAG: hypothetical protein KatS3mg074_007 [Meiothermus sp.]
MESLGHYLLRGRIALPGGGATEVYEGQDIRTGIEVLAFKPLLEEPPKLSIPHTLSWIDREEDAWIAEIPVGAVQTSWLAGRVEVARLVQWVKQLLGVLKQAQENDIPVGYIIPELVWARGSRVWLGGVGVANPEQKWDFAGLLNTVRVIAGDSYPALPWREALENYVTGQLDYAALIEQLEAAALVLPPVSVATPALPIPTEPAPEPIPAKPVASKSLKVQVTEPTVPLPTTTPPRRIRIEDRLEPPFEVLEPPPASRRTLILWLLIIPLMLLAGGIGLWLRSRAPSTGQTAVYPVEFRLQPPGPSASVVILEIPEGSKMPLNVEVAQLPGKVEFDQPGIYRIRVRVQGRAPVESLIEVPNPGGVTISLR